MILLKQINFYIESGKKNYNLYDLPKQDDKLDKDILEKIKKIKFKIIEYKLVIPYEETILLECRYFI